MKTLNNHLRKAGVFLCLTSMLCTLPNPTALHAGIWDSVKNVFIKSEKPQPPTIKILIAHDVDAAVIEVKGKYNIYDPHQNKKLGSYFASKSNLIQPMSSGLKWGEEFPDVFQILIVPDESTITTVVDGIEYKGSIYVYDIGGSISIVNEIDIESYLSSVLTLSVTQPSSEEALAAIAIASRTEAYHRAVSSANPYWHVDAKVVKYQGHAITNQSKVLEKAIEATRYMVMSKTGAYDRKVTPFAIEIVEAPVKSKKSMFSIQEANALAKEGHNAAKILAHFFPHANIQLVHSSDDTWHAVAER